MSRIEAWFVHISTVLVGVTGVVYAVMKYLMEPVDSFAVVGHPWQPGVQYLHIVAAPFAVFAIGLIWKNHVYDHYRRGLTTGRRSGISLMLTMVPMVVSGYLIQVSVGEAWRIAWIVVHCITSFLWITGYLVHQVTQLRKKGILPIGKTTYSSVASTGIGPSETR